jgi:hypothetical protein
MAGEIVWSGPGPMGLPVVEQAKATGRKGSGVTLTMQVRGYKVPDVQEIKQTISLHMSATLARKLYHELSLAALDSETKLK